MRGGEGGPVTLPHTVVLVWEGSPAIHPWHTSNIYRLSPQYRASTTFAAQDHQGHGSTHTLVHPEKKAIMITAARPHQHVRHHATYMACATLLASTACPNCSSQQVGNIHSSLMVVVIIALRDWEVAGLAGMAAVPVSATLGHQHGQKESHPTANLLATRHENRHAKCSGKITRSTKRQGQQRVPVQERERRKPSESN